MVISFLSQGDLTYERFWIIRYIMTKEKLIEIIQGILKTDGDLNFLLQLTKTDLETLVACIRDRVEQTGK